MFASLFETVSYENRKRKWIKQREKKGGFFCFIFFEVDASLFFQYVGISKMPIALERSTEEKKP